MTEKEVIEHLMAHMMHRVSEFLDEQPAENFQDGREAGIAFCRFMHRVETEAFPPAQQEALIPDPEEGS